MRSSARTVAVAVPALVVVSVAWLRLEQPVAPLWRVLALLLLAPAAAVPTRRWLRVVAAVAAVVVGARIAVGVDLVPTRILDPGSGFGLTDSFSLLGTRFGDGLSDFYGTHLPFDPRVHAAMGELVLAAVFGFALIVVLLAAERKPVGAALALLAGAGWPATLLGPSHGVAMGAAILGAALVVLAGLGSRRVPALALPAAVVVAVGAVAVGTATAARHGLVRWQSWNLAQSGGGPVDVGFVWDAQYGGLHWPAHPTVVLRVQSAQAPSYLRAAVLDDFTGDAWSIGPPRAADALEPPAALRAGNQTRETVTVEGLADTHLVGGSIPVRFAAGGAPLDRMPGFAALGENPPRGFRYSVWSYTARPAPAKLLRSAPAYPAALRRDGLLDVGGGATVAPFGAAGRRSSVRALLAANRDLSQYGALVRLAEQVAGGAPTPYAAVHRLEQWFLVSGGFTYSNHPLVIGPPLVGFVTQTRTGYCQFFAGAMTLMLRYLGIPARVAVGFAGGRYDPVHRDWVVTDREAHAWVEVWFKGYGWLPFDPTPIAPGAPVRSTAGAGQAQGGAVGPLRPYPNARATRGPSSAGKELLHKSGIDFGRRTGAGSTAPHVSGGGGGSRSGRGLPILVLLLVLAAAGAAVVLAKVGFRVSRGVRRDPRRIAAACREELAAFLVDQRIEPSRSATLAELGGLVEHEFAVDSRAFVAASTAARYGPAENAEAAARAARQELRDLLGRARRCLTRGERLRGLLSVRSLTRPAAVDASASLGTGMVGSTGS